MKRIRCWAQWISFIVAVISWMLMGLKIYEGNYSISVEACIVMTCLLVILICTLSRVFTDRCPHCGKIRVSKGSFCPYCGKNLEINRTKNSD